VEVHLRHGIWVLLGQLALLIVTVVVALLLTELWLFAALTLFEAFPQRPVLASTILLAIVAVLFLCIRGARMQSRTVVYFASRAVLLIGSAIAGVASLEAIYVGALASGASPSPESYLSLGGGLLLVAVAAAGVRYVFNWRVAYWIVFLAVLSVVIVSIFGTGLSIFLG
jgi:hypothetical protein